MAAKNARILIGIPFTIGKADNSKIIVNNK
jgi:hypothetical protein